MLRTLRPHQASAIDLLKQSLFSGRRRPLLQLPTGAGKTVIATAIVEGALRKGKRVLFCVPALSLIDQTVAAFESDGISSFDIGVMQGGHLRTSPACPVQVASVQTLQRRKLPETDVVLIDEAHRMFEFVNGWMMDPAWARIPFVGLSATPWTKGLGKYYDDLLIAATTQELIDAGYLSPFRVFAPSHPDLSGVKTVAGDYHEGQLAEAMQRGSLVADVVDTWLQRAERRPTLCFAVDRAHAKHLQQKFEEAGVPCGYIDAYTEPGTRALIRDQLHAGTLQVVCNVGCLTTGVDWDVRCISLARPTKSEMLYVQIIGRGLRTAPGKADCLVLDHSDTTLRLGFVTDIQHETLHDGRERQAKEAQQTPLPKECPKCAYLKPARVTVCPSCGFKPEHMPKGIACDDGELVELTPRKLNTDSSWDEKVQFIAELRGFALERGYKEGWAAHKYQEKFGVWPNDPRVKYAAPKPPSAPVRSWIKSRQIAFAKARAA